MKILHAINTSCCLVGMLLLLTNCGQPTTEEVQHTDEYGNIETYTRRLSDFAKVGVYQKTTQDGTLVETATYKNDTLDGVRVLYSEAGDTSIVETYRNGLFDGPYLRYAPNKQLVQKGQYEANMLTGEWTAYFENGQLKEVVQLTNNAENGPFIEYYENGNLKAEGSYLDGDNEHGELKLYDETGELERIMQCDRGRCKTTWSAADETSQ